MDPGAALGDQLLNLTQESWARDLLVLLAITLLAYFPARALRASLRSHRSSTEPEPSRAARTPWVLLEAVVWPILAMLILTVTGKIFMKVRPESAVHLGEVLPVLGFFLLYRCASALARVWISNPGRLGRFRYTVFPLVFLGATLQQLGLWDGFLLWANRPLLRLGEQAISVISLAFAILLIGLFFAMARLVGRLLGSRILPGLGLDRPLSEALGTVVRYSLIVAGFLVALETLGLDLSTLQIGMGALGVGIGFGLQNFVQNFVSGLILLFEGTIKRGDIVSVEGASCKVLRIGLRSSVVRNRKGHEVVVPNSVLTSNPITNFSLSDSLVRIDVGVGVSYEADPREVEKLLLEAADENEVILRRPPPRVLFMNYGDSSIDFELRAWLDDEMKVPQVRSDLLYCLWYKLKDAGVEIPFPQRDLHLKTGAMPIFADSGEENAKDSGGGGEVH